MHNILQRQIRYLYVMQMIIFHQSNKIKRKTYSSKQINALEKKKIVNSKILNKQ